MASKINKVLFALLLFLTLPACAGGNQTIDSFTKAKNLLRKSIYANHNETFYCRGRFDSKGRISLPTGFESQKYKKRANKLEWEHVVPAEHFGQAFIEWRQGHEDCIDSKGELFKGRKCAEKTNQEFRFMLADMYNLYPSIGAVNAVRSNHHYGLLKDVEPTFSGCEFKYDEQTDIVEPPEYTRGTIARTYLYFDDVYPKYNMSSSTRQLMNAWDKMYPVDAWECERAKKIEKIQGNENTFVKSKCVDLGIKW